jgi:ABC-type branched-subunit amino acid transport system substrate-binding protein
MGEEARAEVLADVAKRVALSNELRTDDFQDSVVRLVNSAREHWRDGRGELPRPGTDPAFDALMALAEAADSSPIAVRDAAARALAVAEDVRVTR